MGLKLFPSRRVLRGDEMRSPDPVRQSTDFSDPDYQVKANESAGYKPVGETNISTDGTLRMFSKGNKLYRAQNGVLWEKPKK